MEEKRMLKKSASLVVALIAIMMSIGSVNSYAVTPQSHLKYFGFYGIEGMLHDGGFNFVDDIDNLGITNVNVQSWAFINGDETVQQMAPRVRSFYQELKDKNMVIFQSIDGLLFKKAPGGHLGNGLSTLRADYLQRWSDYKQYVLSGYEDQIAGFYISDEPYLAGITESDFRTGCLLVKNDFPNKKRIVIEGLEAFDPAAFGHAQPPVSDTYFDDVTDVGFDGYNGYLFFDNNGPDGNLGFQAHTLSILKSKATKNQDLWVVTVGAYHHGWNGTMESQQNSMRVNLMKNLEMALGEPRVVGMLVWAFHDGIIPNNEWDGFNQYSVKPESKWYDPALKNLFASIGKMIINGQPSDNLFSSSIDFGNSQGGVNGFSYQEEQGWNYSDLIWDNVNGRWKSSISGRSTWIGHDEVSADTSNSSRQWTAPKAGKIRISSQTNFRKAVPGGDGVGMVIMNRSTGEQIYPYSGTWAQIGPNDTDLYGGISFNVLTTVNQGDVIEFKTTQLGTSDFDRAYLSPVIAYESNSVFYDSFDDGDAIGWTTYGNGGFSVQDGEYAANNGGSFIATADNTNFSDFVYEADVYPEDNGDPQLLFRVSNPSSTGYTGYAFGLKAYQDKVYVEKVNGTGYSILGEAAAAIDNNNWYHIKVVAQGSSIKVFLNRSSTPVISVTDSSFASGSVGLRWGWVHARFDNIAVDAIN